MPTPRVVVAPEASTVYSLEDARGDLQEDSPLMRKHYVVEPDSDDDKAITYEEKVPIFQATIVSRLLFFAEFVMFLGGLMMFTAQIVHYVMLWNLPSDETTRTGVFHYPLALISSIYFIGMSLFGVSGIFRMLYIESVQRIKWWILFIGILVSLSPAAIVIYKDNIFIQPLINGHITIGSEYKSVYATTLAGMFLVIPMVMLLDLFNPILKKSKIYKLLCLFGIFCFQISLIVTIHSLIVHIGFMLFVLGTCLIAAGYIAGRLAERRKFAQAP